MKTAGKHYRRLFLLQSQVLSPQLNVAAGLVVGIAFRGDPQQRFRTGETADHPAAVFKFHLAAVLKADSCGFFRELRQTLLHIHQLLLGVKVPLGIG